MRRVFTQRRAQRLRAARRQRARRRGEERKGEQHHGRGAGEAGGAVEGLQQHDRIGAREEAGDEVRELELADRQCRDGDEAGDEAAAQRGHDDVEEAAGEAGAQGFGGGFELGEAEMPHVADEGLHEIGQGQHDMAGDEHREAAEPRQRVRREDEDEAEAEHQRRHRDRQERDEVERGAQPRAPAGVERIGERQAEQRADDAGRGDDLEAGEEGAAEARVAPDLLVPGERRAARQKRVGPRAAERADRQEDDRQGEVDEIERGDDGHRGEVRAISPLMPWQRPRRLSDAGAGGEIAADQAVAMRRPRRRGSDLGRA
jgi:hypothetical protein